MGKLEKGKKAIEKTLEKIGDVPISEIPAEMIERGRAATESLIAKYGHLTVRAINAVTFKDELRDAFPIFNDELDTDFLLELLYFFPIDKTYISTGSYDQYLYDLEKTVIDNYDSGNYQVSFFYAHLIFMSYAYYCLELAYSIWPDRIKDQYDLLNAYGSRNKPNIEHHENTYSFSKIPEKEIFKVFYAIGLDVQFIQQLSGYVDKRDDYAHASGEGNLSEQAFRQNIKTIIGNMNTLRDLFLPYLKSLYIEFMLERLDVDYDVVTDNFNDFVFDNSLSICDLDYLCHLGVKNLQESNETLKTNYQATRNIHCAFIEYCNDNDGIALPDGYPSLRNEKYLFYRYKNHAKEFIENELGINEYRCVKDGGEFPLYECPECRDEQLVFDAERGKYHCFSCGHNFTDEDLSFCERCGRLMYNKGEPICDNCIRDTFARI
ncbi:MAG: hypothetical protein J5585_11115 [Clostridia bacterium]|nr:hypothetical protein [Clostridia bacterium]